MQNLNIKYGQGVVEASLPDGILSAPLVGKFMAGLDSPIRELRFSLNNPIAMQPFSDAIDGAGDVLIVVSDHTRYLGYEIWLAELLHQINRHGITDDNIKLYVASGTHRPMTDDEKRARFGSGVFNRVEILDHDCDAEERMMKVGRTDYGTVVWVDERVYNSDFLIITGSINYHYFAGYTGGRKALMPGVCSRESILTNHLKAIDRNTGDFAPRVEPGQLVANPVNEDMHEANMLLRPNYCINVVLNSEREIAWMGSGDFGYVHRIGADWLDTFNRPIIETQADVVVVGAGGYPKDLTMFQAHKSLRHSVKAVRHGGTIIWVAECGEGEGPAGMAEWRNLSLNEVRIKVQQAPSLVSFCSLSLKKIADAYNVLLVSTLPAGLVQSWGISPQLSLEGAIEAVVNADSGSSWMVGADMSNILPMLEADIPKPKENEND